MTSRPKLCLVATVAAPLQVFMAPHIVRLAERFDVVLVCNGIAENFAGLLSDRVHFRSFPIARQPSLWADARVSFALWRFFRQERFDVVYSIMPKSGLLAMTMAAMARVPRRVHCFTGQVWATRGGFSRFVLKGMDRLLAACATHLLADSRSQAAFLRSQGIVGRKPITVLGAGSIAGVNCARFVPDSACRERIRAALGVEAAAVMAIYVGRLTPEKGLRELVKACRSIAPQLAGRLVLVLVGPDEQNMRSQLEAEIGKSMALLFVAATPAPEHYLAAADFLVLPSYREGFGTTVIEAAACGLPAIGTRIYGLTDAIVEGETGLLVPPRDAPALAAALATLVREEELRLRLGRNARARVLAQFDASHLTGLLADFFERLLPRGA